MGGGARIAGGMKTAKNRGRVVSSRACIRRSFVQCGDDEVVTRWIDEDGKNMVSCLVGSFN